MKFSMKGQEKCDLLIQIDLFYIFLLSDYDRIISINRDDLGFESIKQIQI
jgi:hypothetical protein